ncbi:MAG TPA: hypothetical protein VGH44_06685 [Candidatus Saccharimonadia bacterium]|jgi:hypothetical protein
MYDYNEYNFTKRLAVLLGTDIAIAILDSFIPQELSPVRSVVGLVEFGFMAATMWLTVRRVLKDY